MKTIQHQFRDNQFNYWADKQERTGEPGPDFHTQRAGFMLSRHCKSEGRGWNFNQWCWHNWLSVWQMWYLTSTLHRMVASLVAQSVENLPPMQETWVRLLGREDPLEKELATHSSILAWRISWTEEPGRLQSMGISRVGHDLATKPPPPSHHTRKPIPSELKM